MTNRVAIQPMDQGRLAVEVASDLQASDIVLLDIRKVSDFADCFVVLTADSSRQMEALVEVIEHSLEGAGVARHHREGDHRSGWMLLDFGDLIVHLFGPEEREFYGIENVWAQAVEVVRLQ